MRVAYIYTQQDKPKEKKLSKKEQLKKEVALMIEEQRYKDRMKAIKFFNKLRNQQAKSK